MTQVLSEFPKTSVENLSTHKIETFSLHETLTRASLEDSTIEKDVTTPQTTPVIISKEYETKFESILPEVSDSTIPEKDSCIWQIKDFSAFREAARISHIPALVSPPFGGGCSLKLNLYERKGHITGQIELPLLKAVKDGVIHIKIFVLKPDHKVRVTRKVEMRIKSQNIIDKNDLKRSSATFRLTKKCPLITAGTDHLVYDDILRIKVDFQYFPFDAQIFRGLTRFNTPIVSEQQSSLSSTLFNQQSKGSDVLIDINNYCDEDPSQNVEIRKQDVTYTVSRFLVCARSTKFREIFKEFHGNTQLESNSYLNYFSNKTPQPQYSLSSITLQDISQECLTQILTFIHTDICEYLEDSSINILKVLELYEAADNYGVQSLQKRLREKLLARMDKENFVYLFDVSQRCHDEEFKRACSEYMDSIPGSQIATMMRFTTTINETPRTILTT